MKIEDRIHEALHDYADPIEPEPGSWARIAARFAEEPAPRAPSRRPLILVGVALALVVVLIGALIVRDGSDDDARVVTAPRSGMPSRVFIAAENGSATVLDSVTGDREFTYGATVTAGTQIAVTPDGQAAYIVTDNGDEGCADRSILQLQIGSGSGSGQVADESSEPTVSPDGRYLAYLRCLPGDVRAHELVLRDLATGEERVTSAPANAAFVQHLEFTSDSRHVFVALQQDPTPQAPSPRSRPFAPAAMMHEIDIVGGEPAPGLDLGVASGGQGWVAVRGMTGEYLGVKGTPPSVLAMSLPPWTAGPLFGVPNTPTRVVSDRSGRHILAVVDHSLYRWSVGEKEPTKIADGVTGAAWIPDPPAPVPTQSSVAVLDRNRVVLIGRDGTVVRELFSHPAIESVTPAIDGRSVYVITNDPGPCRGGPQTFRVPLDGGEPKNLLLTGITSLVEMPTADGTRIAYTGDIECSDAGRIGFGTIADPRIGLGDPPEVRLAGDATEVKILDASPDGEALLVRVVRPSGAALVIVDVASGAVTTVPETESVEVAAFSGDVANAFLQIVSARSGRTRLELIDREGHAVSAWEVPAGGLALDTNPLRLLGVTDTGDRTFVWHPERVSNLDLSGLVTAATWIPDAARPERTTSMPAGVLAVIGGQRISFLGSQDGQEHETLTTGNTITGVSASADGKQIVFAHYAGLAACGDLSPELDQIDPETKQLTRVGGPSDLPVVSPDGQWVAYGLWCDGTGPGITSLPTGANYREDALGSTTSESDASVESTTMLGWSPDGDRLVYRLMFTGDPAPHYYAGKLWPVVPQSQTEVIPLPSGTGILAATFLEDETVALAESPGSELSGAPTAVRSWKVQTGTAEQSSSVLFQLSGRITSLVADPSGQHLLALTQDGDLYRWSRGDERPTKLAAGITAATWYPGS